MVGDIQREDGRGIKVVHGNIEEPLNLRGVQVHCQNTFDSGTDHHIGHQFGRDRRARLGAAVLPGIAEIRDHRGDAAGRRPAQTVAHDQQFHQVVIGRVRCGLDDEHVLTPDIFEHFDKDLAIVEPLDPRIHQSDMYTAMHAHPAGNGFGQWTVSIPSNKLGFVQLWHVCVSPVAAQSMTDS